jgi:hypothetical protein
LSQISIFITCRYQSPLLVSDINLHYLQISISITCLRYQSSLLVSKMQSKIPRLWPKILRIRQSGLPLQSEKSCYCNLLLVASGFYLHDQSSSGIYSKVCARSLAPLPMLLAFFAPRYLSELLVFLMKR